MKFSLSIIGSLGIVALSFLSCERNEEIEGCTNHLAENHNPRATVDDGSCTFSEETQLIWKDSVPGGWNGNVTTYGFVPTVCTGDMLAESDTSSTGIPASLYTDSNGNMNVQFRLVNPRTARNYIEGFVHFDVLVPEDSNISMFGIYIHGKEVETDGNCGEYIRSDKLELSALALSSETFTTVSVPFRDFNQLLLADIGVAFGIAVTGATPDTEILRINNIRWTRF